MPALGATVAIIHEGQVLLTRREDFEVWCLPGGYVEDGESLAEAAVREAFEETGLEVELTRLVGAYSRPRWVHGGLHLILFAAQPVGGMLRLQPTEVIEAGYFALHALPSPLLWGSRQMVVDALDGTTGVARSLLMAWPLAEAATRQELYDLRDRSGLPRQQFFRQHLMPPDADAQTLEVIGHEALPTSAE